MREIQRIIEILRIRVDYHIAPYRNGKIRSAFNLELVSFWQDTANAERATDDNT